MRVTIVATGLGAEASKEVSKMKLVQSAATAVDYKELERPTVMRNQDAPDVANALEDDPEYLDIPAFLRRQAD